MTSLPIKRDWRPGTTSKRFPQCFSNQVLHGRSTTSPTLPSLFLFIPPSNVALTTIVCSYNVLDPHDASVDIGVPHGAEGGAVFGYGGAASLRTTNAHIIPIVENYWTSFIRSYNPNTYRHAGTPEWETWSGKETPMRLLLEANTTRMENVDPDQRKRCEYCSKIATSIKQ